MQDASGVDEDSHHGDSKQEDFWGCTWSRVHRINTLRYTTVHGKPGGRDHYTSTAELSVHFE